MMTLEAARTMARRRARSLHVLKHAGGPAGFVAGAIAAVAAPSRRAGAQLGALGVTWCVVWWWLSEAVPLGVASLAPAVLLPLVGAAPSRLVCAAYFSDTIALFFGSLLVASAVERCGLHRRFALALLSALGGSPARLLLGFIAGAWLLSMWISNTATTAAMMPIATAVLSQVGGGDDGAGADDAGDAGQGEVGDDNDDGGGGDDDDDAPAAAAAAATTPPSTADDNPNTTPQDGGGGGGGAVAAAPPDDGFPPLTAGEYDRYMALFREHDTDADGFVDGATAAPLFKKVRVASRLLFCLCATAVRNLPPLTRARTGASSSVGPRARRAARHLDARRHRPR